MLREPAVELSPAALRGSRHRGNGAERCSYVLSRGLLEIFGSRTISPQDNVHGERKAGRGQDFRRVGVEFLAS